MGRSSRCPFPSESLFDALADKHAGGQKTFLLPLALSVFHFFFSLSPLFFFWYSSIFLLHSSPCSKLTGLLTFACRCIETPGVTTRGLGQSLSLSPGQIKQPNTKQSVTHSLNRSACVYKVCFFTYTHVHVRLGAWMLSCGYVHALSWVCVCAHGAAGVILAEEGHESQTAFPPAISLGTLQAYICISKEKALLDWPWNR